MPHFKAFDMVNLQYEKEFGKKLLIKTQMTKTSIHPPFWAHWSSCLCSLTKKFFITKFDCTPWSPRTTCSGMKQFLILNWKPILDLSKIRVFCYETFVWRCPNWKTILDWSKTILTCPKFKIVFDLWKYKALVCAQ